jgi:putative ABC transport system permease protein
MNRIGLRMLFGSRGRYAALIFGLSIAVFLSTQQVAILLGVLQRATGPLQNIGVADLWVVSRETSSIDYLREMHDRQLMRVRSIAGIQWAEPMIAVKVVCERPDGGYSNVHLLGIDRSSRIGKPPQVVEGDLAHLGLPDTIFLEVSARNNLPGVGIGDVVYFSGRRARVVGTCRARTGIEGRPVLYTSLENARRFIPAVERRLSVILVKVKSEADVDAVRRAIRTLPDITAFSAEDFRWSSMLHIMLRTGIGLNFTSTAVLGFVVGVVLASAAFYQFTTDNLPYFALLRAVGARRATLIRIVLGQAMTAGLIGYGIGIGLAGLATLPGLAPDAMLAARFPWPLLPFGVAPMLACVGIGSLINLGRVLRAEPAILFQ